MKRDSNSMLKNSMKLISASTIVQVLAFLLLPIVGRIYSESEIGQISVFLSIVGVLSVVATGRYDQATVFAKSKERALLLLFTALRFNLIFCVILVPIVLIINPLLSGSQYSGQQNHLFLIPFFVFFAAAVTAFMSWANSHNLYGRMGFSQVYQGVTNNTLRIAFGFVGGGFWGLQTSALLSNILGIYPLVKKQSLWSQFKKHITPNRLKITANFYSKFPRYSLPQAVIDILSGSLITLLLPLQYQDAAIGLYGMAYMLAGRPLQIISDSLCRVWFRRIAEQKNNKKSFLNPVKRFVLSWTIIAVSASVLLFYLLEPLVVFILGEKWIFCASVIMAMLPFFFFNFLSSIFNFLPDLFGFQSKFMKIQGVLLLIQLTVIIIGTQLLPFEKYIWLHFAERGLDSLIQITWFYFIVRKYENQFKHRFY